METVDSDSSLLDKNDLKGGLNNGLEYVGSGLSDEIPVGLPVSGIDTNGITLEDTHLTESEHAFSKTFTSANPLQHLETQFTLDELKDKCREYSLKISGRKNEVAQRLLDHFNSPMVFKDQLSHPKRTMTSPKKSRTIKKPKPSPVESVQVRSDRWDPAVFSFIEAKDPTSTGYIQRTFHTSVVYINKLFVFGGACEPAHGRKAPSGHTNELLTFDFETGDWRLINTKGMIPSPRREHSAVVYDGIMYVFGGVNGQRVFNDLYAISLKEGENQFDWIQIHSDSHLDNHSLQNNGLNRHMMINNSHATLNCPAPRCAHSSIVLGKSMYIFGGYNSRHSFLEDWGEIICSCSYQGEWGCNCAQPENDVFNDLWEFSFEARRWQQISYRNDSSWPSARNNHYCFSKHNNQMFIGGGLELTWPELHEGPYEDLWKFDCEKQQWEEIKFKGDYPVDPYQAKAQWNDEYAYIFNDENKPYQKSIYRYSFANLRFEKCKKIPDTDPLWDDKDDLCKYEFVGMSVNIVDRIIILLGNFRSKLQLDHHENSLDDPQKSLIGFSIDKF